MNVFHHHLEAVETAGLGGLNLSHETLSEVLEDDAVGCCEEGQHVLDEVLLVVGQLLPVLNVLSEVDFFGRPEGRLLVLVHLPDVVILDWEKHEAVGVLLKKRLFMLLSLRDGLYVNVRFYRFLKH